MKVSLIIAGHTADIHSWNNDLHKIKREFLVMSEMITHCISEVVTNSGIKYLSSFKFLLPEIISEHLKRTSYWNQLVYLKCMIFQICYIRMRDLAPLIIHVLNEYSCQVCSYLCLEP